LHKISYGLSVATLIIAIVKQLYYSHLCFN